MWTISENKIMTYSEYLLSEAIKPTVTEYGTDFKNEKWKNVGEGFYITHFKTDQNPNRPLETGQFGAWKV